MKQHGDYAVIMRPMFRKFRTNQIRQEFMKTIEKQQNRV